MGIPEKRSGERKKRTGGACASPAVCLSSSGLTRILCLVFLIFLIFLFALLSLLRSGRPVSRSDDDHLIRIVFPGTFAAFTGYTPDEEEALWREAEDSSKRYTLLKRDADDALSLYVTPSQLQYNRRLYEDGLKGWTIRCESRGVQVHPSGDYRSVRLIADSYDAYQDALGELRAALTAVSCLQIIRNAPADDWSLRAGICVSSSPDEEIASFTLPGEELSLTRELWP